MLDLKQLRMVSYVHPHPIKDPFNSDQISSSAAKGAGAIADVDIP